MQLLRNINPVRSRHNDFVAISPLEQDVFFALILMRHESGGPC